MNRFAYATVSSVEEAVRMLGEGGHRTPECLPLAGGVDLLDMMKEGLIISVRSPGCFACQTILRSVGGTR
jgi:CO/xanthine dehydrogenase FAD-binding subunit